MLKIHIKLNIKREKEGLNRFNDPKAFIEYSNDMQGAYKNIDEYNVDKERKKLIVSDDMIADMINNKKLILFKRQKIKHFFCFYYPIVF